MSFAATLERKRLGLGLAMGMAASSFSAVAPPPKLDLSGHTPTTTSEIKATVAGHTALKEQLTAMTGSAPKADKPSSILGDALKVLNPLDIKGAGVSGLAMMAGMGPAAVIALGVTASLTNGMHPIRSAQRNFTPKNPVQSMSAPKASADSPYTSWADQVAPIMATPTMMVSQFGAPRKPAPQPKIEDLQRQFSAYDRALRGMAKLDAESSFDATQPNMLTDKALAQMDPTHKAHLIRTGQTDLAGTGISQETRKSLHGAPAPSMG